METKYKVMLLIGFSLLLVMGFVYFYGENTIQTIKPLYDRINSIPLEANDIPNENRINIVSGESEWNIIHHSGEERNYTIQFENKSNKKTIIYLCPNEDISKQDLSKEDKKLSLENGEVLTDSKGKEVKTKWNNNVCVDGGYEIKLTDTDTEKVNNYFKIGENSIILVYQENKEVIFSISDTQNISARLYWDLNGDGSDWNNSVNDIFVYFNETKWKFGATNNESEWEHYKYILESNTMFLIENGKYVFKGDTDYVLNLDDICEKQNASCEYFPYTKNGKYYLEVDFYSDENIDPAYQEENKTLIESDYIPRDERVSCNGNKCKQSSSQVNMFTNEGYQICENVIDYQVNLTELTLYMGDNNVTMKYSYDVENTMPIFDIKQHQCTFHFFQNINDENINITNMTIEIPEGFEFVNNQITNGLIEIDFTKAVEYQNIEIVNQGNSILLTGENITNLDPTTGEVAAGLGEVVAFAGNSEVWTNPTNIYVSDGIYAETGNMNLEYSNYLRATEFGFSIPSGATIDGIVTNFEKRGYSGTPFDKSIRLVKNYTITGSDLANWSELGAGQWSLVFTYTYHGGESYLWNTTWTAEDINADGFGVVIAAKDIWEDTCYARVDYIGMEVFYTESVSEEPGAFNCSKYTSTAGRYYLTSEQLNIGSYCVSIAGDNIEIDCMGHMIDGTGSIPYGIQIGSGLENITIRNCIFSDFTYGIYGKYDAGVIIDNCTFNPDLTRAIYFQYVNANITNSLFNSSKVGIYLYRGGYSTGYRAGIIANNTFNPTLLYNYYPIYLYQTDEYVIYNNYFNSSSFIYGTSTSYPNQINASLSSGTNIVQGNLIGGNFWATPSGDGFSETCADSDENGICDGINYLGYANYDNHPLSRIDGEDPYVYIYRPKNDSYLNGDVVMKTLHSDNIGIRNIVYYMMNSTSNKEVCNETAEPFECEWNTDEYSNDTEGYFAYATAYDYSGNHANTTYLNQIWIDRNKPYSKQSSVQYPNNQESARNGQIIWTYINVTDGSGSGINVSYLNVSNINGSQEPIYMNKQSGSIDPNEWSYWNMSINVSGTTGNQELYYSIKDFVTPTPNIRDSDVEIAIIDNDIPTYDSMTDTDDYGNVYNNTEVFYNIMFYDNYDLDNYIFANNFTGTWQNETPVSMGGTSTLGEYSQIMYFGNYSYYWIIEDDAGNIATTSLGNVIILGNQEFGVLNVQLIEPENMEIFDTNYVDLYYKYEEGVAKNCSLLIDDVYNQSVEYPSNYTTLNFNATFDSDDYTWKIVCSENTTETDYYSEERIFLVDSIYPTFNTPLENPTDSTSYSENKYYYFNITIENTLGSAGINFNGTNYSMNNLSSVYNSTIYNLGVGMYDYYFWGYGNGSANNYNQTETYTYTIDKNNTLLLGISGTTPITYPQITDVSGSLCPSQLSCSLSPSNIIYGVSVSPIKFNYSTSGNQNYTATSITKDITINQNSTPVYLWINNSRSNFAGTDEVNIDINVTDIVGRSVRLYINGSLITSSETNYIYDFPIYSGDYNVTAYFEGNENYSSSMEYWNMSVSHYSPSLTNYLLLDLLYPTTSQVNVTPNEFFYVDVNVTCKGDNCGEVNVSLDPPVIQCYQETANVSTACGGLNTGVYGEMLESGGYFTDMDNFYDEDWNTYGTAIGIDSYLMNYTIPTGTINATWQVKDGAGIRNYTLSSGCLSNSEGKVILKIRLYGLTKYYYCYNETTHIFDWFDYKASSTYNFYEEAIIWEFEGVDNVKNGLISTIEGATPFYTNNSNPRNITLNVDESQVVRFWVNATGTEGINHTFFAYANMTSEMSISNITDTWEVEILDTTCYNSLAWTDWSEWQNQGSCLENDTQVKNQSRVQWDTAFCGNFTNITEWNYTTEICDFCTPNLVNTSWSSWENTTCFSGEMNQSRYKIEYDDNYCVEIANTTYYEYQLVSPIYENTSWGDWLNISCLSSDTMNQSRNLTSFDLFGCGSNVTYFEYQNVSFCDFCTPNMTYMDWTSWSDMGSCEVNNTILQNRSRIYWDSQLCEETGNTTEWDYQEAVCDYPPIVILELPENANITNNPNITFQYNLSDNYGLDNCSLWTNTTGTWHLNQTDTSVENGTNYFYLNLSLINVTYNWNVQCLDNETSFSWGSNNYTFTLSTGEPPAGVLKWLWNFGRLTDGSLVVRIREDGLINATALRLFSNLTIRAPNGNYWACGVNNSGYWGCDYES